jgi:hypothetical protein
MNGFGIYHLPFIIYHFLVVSKEFETTTLESITNFGHSFLSETFYRRELCLCTLRELLDREDVSVYECV